MPQEPTPGGGTSVLDHLLEGAQIIGPDWRYLYVNEAVARQGRRRRDELLGSTMMEAYPGIDRTPMFAALERCMHERVPVDMENEFTFPDGSRGWFELRFEPVPAGVFILSIEITERKRAELLLRRSQRALATLSGCNQALVVAVDEDAFVQRICRIVVDRGEYRAAIIARGAPGNEAVRRVAHAGLEGASPALVGALCAGEGLGAPLASALERGEVIQGRVEAPQGSAPEILEEARGLGLASYLALPIRDGDQCFGALAIFAAEPDAFDREERAVLAEAALDLGFGLAGIRGRQVHEETREAFARAVIDRVRALQELEQSQMRMRAVFEHLPHPTLLWRWSGDDFRLGACNEAARRFALADLSSHIGASPGALSAVLPELADDLVATLATGEPRRREVAVTREGDRAPHHLLLHYASISADTVLLSVEDVTEQRRTQAQFLAAQKLEAVGRLAGAVAHDFNNLLTVINTYSGLAVEDLPAESPIRADVEEVQKAGHRAAALTGQLLAFSRRQPLDVTVLSLNAVVSGIEGMLRRLLGAELEIRIDLAEDVGPILGDASQLEQVLMNLAVNARDAMPRGGTLSIQTRETEVTAAISSDLEAPPTGRYVTLTVSDTGEGMDAATRERIFEPFFTTKEKGKGTGLGLATVYGIVRQSGGHIRVSSERGRGTSFEILFPRAKAAGAKARPLTPPPLRPPGSATVLVLEDDTSVARVAQRILEASGYRVLVAASGEEAGRYCDAPDSPIIDLLLSDVVLPGLTGPEFADRLRRRFPSLRVLYTSGYTDDDIHRRGVTTGPLFLAKPFTPQQLVKRVRQALDATPASLTA